MNTNRLDDQMNSILVAVFAVLTLTTALGVGEGMSFGRADPVAPGVAQAPAQAPDAQDVPRITVVAHHEVAQVAAAD
ncbi:hypothetical protein GCM10025771_00380 [Niveibacterium umoris]|uniref:Uncharacterized protein n=1 Tax=Niveibacterium umoris TaxID=1193620 RepID=A0A840BTA5_9RHOO|nr:hypothetical protein [Niveibacterium umoris]MBB4014902.1 hypothetical protein [Niveibacterium umoris]